MQQWFLLWFLYAVYYDLWYDLEGNYQTKNVKKISHSVCLSYIKRRKGNYERDKNKCLFSYNTLYLNLRIMINFAKMYHWNTFWSSHPNTHILMLKMWHLGYLIGFYLLDSTCIVFYKKKHKQNTIYILIGQNRQN